MNYRFLMNVSTINMFIQDPESSETRKPHLCRNKDPKKAYEMKRRKNVKKIIFARRHIDKSWKKKGLPT